MRTWENDFLSDRWELREDGALLATVDKISDEYWLVCNRNGVEVTANAHDLAEAQSIAGRISQNKTQD